MATFEFRSGKWRAKIVRRALGIDESATFPTKAQASAWATKREAEILAGARGLPTGHTVADAIDRFIRDACPKRQGGRWDEIRLLKFRQHKLASKPLSKLTSDDMAQWRDERLKEVSPSSVARELNLWGALFTVAVREWKWCLASPVRGVKRPSEPPARRRGISQEEIAALVANLNGVSGIQIKAAFLLALETAMRAGEIIGLTWDHVDLVNRVVTLPKTKNGDSRQVPLSLAAKDCLVNRLSVQGQLEHPASEVCDRQPTGLAERVFTITSATLDTLFRRARDKAALVLPSCATVRFHDSRSEAITRLSRKLDVLELARVVGHRSPASLMFYYSKSAAEIAKKLD